MSSIFTETDTDQNRTVARLFEPNRFASEQIKNRTRIRERESSKNYLRLNLISDRYISSRTIKLNI